MPGGPERKEGQTMFVQTIFDGDHSLTTLDLPLSRRVAYWQDRVRDSLIGIDCTASAAGAVFAAITRVRCSSA